MAALWDTTVISYCGEVNGVLGIIVPSILLRLLLLELQYLPL